MRTFLSWIQSRRINCHFSGKPELALPLDSSHPYPEDLHSRGQNSWYPCGTLDCTLLAFINRHPKGFWSRDFYRPDDLFVAQAVSVSKYWRPFLSWITIQIADWMRNESSPPSLAALSKTNQSLILQWRPSLPAVEDITNLTYRIQRLTIDLDDDWQYHDDVTWLSRQRVRINGLRPYVTYKVRFICKYLSSQ